MRVNSLHFSIILTKYNHNHKNIYKKLDESYRSLIYRTTFSRTSLIHLMTISNWFVYRVEMPKNDKDKLIVPEGEVSSKISRWRVVPLLSYTYIGCFLSSMTMTFTRCLTGFAVTENEKGSNFRGIMPKVYIVLIPVLALIAYYWRNKAIKHFNTVYVVPLFKAGDLLHNLLCGGIFLREFGQYATYDLTMFMVGIFIWTWSVWILILANDKNESKVRSKK